jgi:hypothetical protein
MTPGLLEDQVNPARWRLGRMTVWKLIPGTEPFIHFRESQKEWATRENEVASSSLRAVGGNQALLTPFLSSFLIL